MKYLKRFNENLRNESKVEEINEEISLKTLMPFVMSLMMSYKTLPAETINSDRMEISQTMDNLTKIEHDLGELKYRLSQEKPKNYEQMMSVVDSIEDLIETKDMSKVATICDMIESLSDDPLAQQTISAIRNGDIDMIRQSLNNSNKMNVESQEDNTPIVMLFVTLIGLSMIFMASAFGSRRNFRRNIDILRSEEFNRRNR